MGPSLLAAQAASSASFRRSLTVPHYDFCRAAITLVLGLSFPMAHLLPTSLVDGERSRDDTDNDASDAGVGVGVNGGAQLPSMKAQKPSLFHKIRNQRSILALLISDSKIYAGTQNGDLLVCHSYSLLKL